MLQFSDVRVLPACTSLARASCIARSRSKGRLLTFSSGCSWSGATSDCCLRGGESERVVVSTLGVVGSVPDIQHWRVVQILEALAIALRVEANRAYVAAERHPCVHHEQGREAQVRLEGACTEAEDDLFERLPLKPARRGSGQ